MRVFDSDAAVSAMVLVAAAGLDFMVGDPWGWPHPVQAMGWVISLYARVVLAWRQAWQLPPWVMKLLGVGLACLLIGGSAGLSGWLLSRLALVSPTLKVFVEVVLLASCFAGRSLRRAADDVLIPLHGDPLDRSHASSSEVSGPEVSSPEMSSPDISEARNRLAMYVGRDTQHLSAIEIRRAILETVSENAIDGVLAPLFYALVGAATGHAIPCALAYKAASTLDSMVGYRTEAYKDLGWFSAQFEDVLTWLPCRLSVGMVAFLSGKPRRVLHLCWRDARADPSPNAGWSECAYAAALGVQLGGANTYQGQLKVKPLLAEDTRAITADVIAQALRLTRWSFLIGLSSGVLGLLILASWHWIDVARASFFRI